MDSCDKPDQPSSAAALDFLIAWYESHRAKNGSDPPRSVVCAGLVFLERMRREFPVERASVVTPKNRVSGAGYSPIKRILSRYGEERDYVKEGGRTTSSAVTAIEQLIPLLNECEELRDVTDEERIEKIDELQKWLAGRATEYFNQQRIQVRPESDLPGRLVVSDLLVAAGAKSGPVAQHLVGAKLAVRFRDKGIEVENHGHTTADQQLRRHGDFVVGSTVFHVTVAPGPAVIEKCKENIRNRLQPKLLVNEKTLQAARQLLEIEGLERKVDVLAIEPFVGQNIEELGCFDQTSVTEALKELFAEFNRRVGEAETDPSLLLDLPDQLQ